MKAQAVGRMGEQLAAQLLEQVGYTVLCTNYHSPYGEIDVIAAGEDCLCFVEVKTRRDGAVVSGEAAVDRRKQRKIIATALLYLQEHPSELQPRFDVVCLVTDRTYKAVTYNHYKGAFDLDDFTW